MGEEKRTLSCTDCGVLNCHKRNASYPEFCLTEKLTDEDIAETTALYEDEENRKVSVISAEIEGEFYGKYTRVDEIIEFAKRMGYKSCQQRWLQRTVCSHIIRLAHCTRLKRTISDYWMIKEN